MYKFDKFSDIELAVICEALTRYNFQFQHTIAAKDCPYCAVKCEVETEINARAFKKIQGQYIGLKSRLFEEPASDEPYEPHHLFDEQGNVL